MASPTDNPIVLDPYVSDLEGERERLCEAGPIAWVELPGGVRTWSVTHHRLPDSHRLPPVEKHGALGRLQPRRDLPDLAAAERHPPTPPTCWARTALNTNACAP